PSSEAAAPSREPAPASPPSAAMLEPSPVAAPPGSTGPGDGPTPPAAEVDAAGWPDLLARLGLRGPVRELAAHTGFVGYADGVLQLSLPPSDDHLKAPFLVGQLAEALAAHFGKAPQIRFTGTVPAGGETLHQRHVRQRDARQREAENAF